MALTANQDWLYKQMSGKNVDLGSEEQFAQAMQDESNRQWVYEQAGKMGIDLGTPEQFASAMLPTDAAQTGVSGGSLLSEQEELARQNAIQGVTNDPNHPFEKQKQPNAFQTFYKGLGAGVINTANGLLGFLNRANSGRLAYDPVTLQQMVKQGKSPEEIEQAAQSTLARLDSAETDRYNAWKEKADQLSAEAKPDGGEKSFTDYIAEGKIGKALQLGLGTAAESLPYTASALNPVATASMIMSMSEQNYRQSLIDNPDMSDGQRLASAAGNAAIEMAVEHIGNPFKVFKAGKLTTPNATKWIKQVVKESKDNIYKGILRVLGFGAKEAGKEGLEEVITTAGQDLYNTLLDWKDTNGLGLQSQWERMKDQNPDITPEEFALYKAEGLTNDFIGGALSGMMMSGPSTGVGVARAAKYYSKNGGSEESRAQAQQQLAVLQQLATEFDVSQEEVAQAIVDYQAEKQLTPKQQALINRGEEIITNLQNAQSATQATELQEPEQETTPLSPAAAEYQRAVDEVTQAVQERTHGNGYIYPVAMPGNAEKTGYIVGEVVPVIDESNPEQLRIENDDVVTVKWSDGTVTQERARDLNLTGAPMMAQQAINIEVENQMYGYTQQRIQNGEQPVLMRNGEGILEGFFPTEGGLLEDQNGVQYTPEQLAEQGWQETKPVLFVNDTQQIATLDNGDGTYTQVDALGNPIAEPMSAEAFSEQGFAMVPLEEEQPKSQAPVEAPVVEQAPVQQAPEVQQPEVQAPAAPVVPNIETMSAEELGGSAVEYMGDRASAMAYLEAERDKADAEVQRTSKLKVTRFNGPEDFKRQHDQIQAAKRAAIDRYNKLQNAITAANAYKTVAEQQEEAERKAREAAMHEQRRQLAEAETAGDIEAKWQNTKKTVGFAATKTLPNGQKVNGHYILTEAGDVVPSHDPRKNYADSEGYLMENGQNVNDNNYKDPDVQRIALDIAQNYGGQAVEQMPFLENRAGRVLSGNNRTISGIIAAENNTDQAYLAALEENAQQYGFTPEQLAEYEHPRLQFVVEDELPFTTATFAMFNQQEKKTKSSVNRAVANSKMVTEAVRDKMLEIMDQYESLDSFFGSESAAADIVQALITEGLMTQQEVAGLTENTGSGFKFGQSGREYVTDMLLGTLFDEQTIKMLAGEKTLKQAILRALPSIVANRRLKGYELTDSINNAIQLLYEARKANEGKSTADAFQLYLRQVDAFKGSVMDRYNGFDIILANRMSAGVEQLREILGLYNNSAMNEANGQMGFFEPRTIDDIKQDVYEYYTNQQPELAAAINGGAASNPQPQSAVSSGTPNEGEVRQEVTPIEEAKRAIEFKSAEEERFFDDIVRSLEQDGENPMLAPVEALATAKLYADRGEIVADDIDAARKEIDAALAAVEATLSKPNVTPQEVADAWKTAMDIYDKYPTQEEKAQNLQENLQESEKSSTFALSNGQSVSKAEYQQQLGDYLQTIKDIDHEPYLCDNSTLLDAMAVVGAKPGDIASAQYILGVGGHIDGFYLNGYVILNVDELPDFEKARSKYVHERQHDLTRKNIHRVQEVMKAASEQELKDLLFAYTGHHIYDMNSYAAVADEFISFSMEEAYKVDTDEELEDALKGFGVKDELINIIKSINDEQRGNQSFALARRNAPVYQSSQNSGAKSRGNSKTSSQGNVRQGGTNSYSPSVRGAESGGNNISESGQVTPFEKTRLGLVAAEFRRQHPDAAVGILFREKDSYEFYDKDAVRAAEILGLQTTEKDGVPFLSFPLEKLQDYLGKLVRGGMKIGITRKPDHKPTKGDYQIGDSFTYDGKTATIQDFTYFGTAILDVEGRRVEVSKEQLDDILESPTENQETTETKASQSNAAEIEIGGALVDRLGDMGLKVSTDLAANRQALKEAKADKSEAGTIHYFRTPSGKQYGFAYKGKVYLDPTKINAELPLHEYGHLWAEALRRLNPENWQRVVETIKADKDAWAFVRELRPELTDENEIAEEVIATFSGKNGAEKMRAEYERMHGKDADYKSKWGNIFKNISKAIQDFWKAVGDFLNIKYTSAEQVYDQVLKDFVDNMNPWKRVSDYLQARDKEYVQAAESGDIKTATNLFYDALKENIGNGITPYMSVGTYTQLKRLAKGVKTRNEGVIKEAAAKIAPLIPDNAVLIPAPSHDGRATDMLDLAKAIAEITGSEVADVLRSAPRESQYQAKKATGVPMASGQLGITMEGTLPEGKTPIIIDNVVDSGNTAEACVQAVGRAVVVTIGDSAEQYRHAASLKSAAPVLRDKAGKVIPLSKRFEPKGSRYLGRRMYLRPDDLRLSVGGTQTIPVGKNTLVGLHNISAEKLRKALKMGGLANPSAAVIDLAKQDHHNYGDISLVMPSSLVDSETGRNAGTYAGDAYTPTYPGVEFHAGKDTAKKIEALTKGLPKVLDDAIQRHIRDYMDGNTYNSGLEYLFLKERGQELPIEHTPRRYPYITIEEIYKRLGMEYPGYYDSSSYAKYEAIPEDQLAEFNLWLQNAGNQEEIDKRKANIARMRSEGKDNFANTLESKWKERMSFANYDSTLYRIVNDGSHAGEENPGMTLDKAKDLVETQGLRPEFEEWMQAKIDDLGYTEVLFDGWTPSGNRRLLPNTLENASKIMNRQDQTNYREGVSVSETKSMLMDKFRTLAQIRKHKDILEPDEEKIKEAYETVSDDWLQLGVDFRDYTKADGHAYGLADNPFTAIDTALYRIQEAMFKRDPIAWLNKEYRYSIPADNEWLGRIMDLKQRITNLPARYFETKFRRPVYLNEFANAVVPNDLPQDLRVGLESAGLRLFGYDPNTQGSRRDATLEATAGEGIRFAISGRGASTGSSNRSNRDIEALRQFESVRPEIAKEMESIKNNALNDGTFMKAPNGKPTNLDERQWLQVRARAFKRWFGDWENDPQNASKILDENGEPMVVYHGTHNNFYTFDKKGGKRSLGILGDYDVDSKGFFFAPTEAEALEHGKRILPCLLNIRKPLLDQSVDLDSEEGKKQIEDVWYIFKPLLDADLIYDSYYGTVPQWMKEEFEKDHKAFARRLGLSWKGHDFEYSALPSWEYIDTDEFKECIARMKELGYDGMRVGEDNGYSWFVTTPNQIKSATNNNGDFSEENDDIRFSISNQNNDIFYSNAERAVEGIKQEKATPEQWRAMIEKAGGLKAGEDKWIGLSDWLAQQRPTVELQPNETRSQYIARLGEESKRFTISKQDILDYIREHKIQIEDVNYQEGLSADAQQKLDDFRAEFDELFAEGEDATGSLYMSDYADYAWNQMIERYGDDFEQAFELEKKGSGRWTIEPQTDYYGGDLSDAAKYFLDSDTDNRPIESTRLRYTTHGLENKREIALIVPTIKPWNDTDEVHFGDAGPGKAIAWVRFGETHHTTYDDGKVQAAEDVLVIDEIQSKRHQEGREKGYKATPTKEEYKEIIRREKVANSLRGDKYDFEREMKVKYGSFDFEDIFKSQMTDAERDEWRQYDHDVDEAEAELHELKDRFPYDPSTPPVAPFEKNWHELAMKRILRFAAENGYDKVAWTTGEQQAKRYDIGKEIDHIVKTDENTYEVYPTSGLMMTLEFDENGMYADEYDREYNGKSMSDIFGKDLAKRLKEMPVDETLQGDGLRVGYDGMKGFYDDILPRFMQKYGKKWGVQVGEVTMPDLEEGYQTMHAIDINDAMRESVMEGQPMFSISGRGVNGTMKPQEGETRSQYIARVAETVKNMTPRNTTIDDAIRFSITVNHNSPYLLKKADGSFIDPETGERLGFDHRFMGKGEGGQAHGWGSYFSVRDIRSYATYNGEGEYKGKRLVELPRTRENLAAAALLDRAYYWRELSFPDMQAQLVKTISSTKQRWEEMGYPERGPRWVSNFLDREAADKSIDEYYESYDKWLQDIIDDIMSLKAEDFELPRRHHYSVDIPDNTGENYLEEDKQLTQEQVDRLREQAKKDGILKDIKGFLYCCENLEDYPFRKFLSDITTTADIGGAGMTDKEASEFLSRAGFVGIHYDGRRDGECYVIFDENDAKITNHIRFAVSGIGNEEKNARKEQNNLHNSEKSSNFAPKKKLTEQEKAVGYQDMFRRKNNGQFPEGNGYGYSANFYHLFERGRLIESIQIEGNEDLIKEISRRYGTNESTRDAGGWTESFWRSQRASDSHDGIYEGQRAGNVGTDGVHGQQSTDSSRDYQEVGRDMRSAQEGEGRKDGEIDSEEFFDSHIRFSVRKEPAPKKTGIGYKVFYRGKDGQLYPPMVANPNGEATPVGVWLNADAAPVAGESKTGRPQVKAGGKGTQGGSGQLAYRPGWHLGEIPYALQFNRKDENGEKTLFPKDFVWAEVEYAADNDYQEEAMREGVNNSGKFQHSLAGLKHVPTDGFYRYRTNPNPETDPWIITGAMKVNRVLTNEEVDDIVRAAGREPQRREGDERSWKTVAEVDKELQENGYSDESPIRFSVAYHGTGADFDKFLKSKINTGEGSQAFGWGLYFTDAKEIAEDYAKRQARQPKNAKEAYMGDQKLNPVAPETDYDCLAWVLDMNELRNIRTMNPDVARSIVKNTIALKKQELKDRIKFYEGNGATRMVESAQEELEYYRRAGELVREVGVPNIEFRGDRNLYTVSIPEDNGMNYFEWNAEIDDRLKSSIIDGIVRRMEQIPEYGNTPGYAARIVPDFMQPYHVGGVVYQVGTRWLPKEEMSEVLAELGYKGIKYDAGTNFSQGVPDGAKNYVVFDDKDIEITEHIRFSISGSGTMKPQADETRKEYIERVAAAVKRMTPRSATIDDAIRFSITVNHNSPYLLKKADGSFVDPETGGRLGFDHRFMGKGEGGQAHGWGTYLSVNDLWYYAENGQPADPTYQGLTWKEWDIEERDNDKGNNVEQSAKYQVAKDLLSEVRRGTIVKENIPQFLKSISSSYSAYGEDYVKAYTKAADEINIADIEYPEPRRHHYTVAIPDNDGTNYLDEIKTLPKPLRRKIAAAVRELPGEPMPSVKYVNYTGGWRQLADMIERNQWAYLEIRDRLFNAFGGYPIDSEKKLSKMMSSLGFVGVHYDGRRDGECYVIFDENDAVITDHIRFAISGNGKAPSSAVTEALVKQANDSFRLMQSALKKVSADLRTINAIRTQQFEYDRKVVDMLLDLYNSLLQENSVWAGYMPDTTRRIATQIVHAIGKKDISAEVNTIMDHMVHAQAKAAQRQWDKLRQTPIDKINISGVVMQGKVALQGQHALKAMNEALEARLSVEQLEDQIAQLMDMEDNATDESLKLQYKGQWIGYTIAAQHLERIQHLVDERNQLDIELQAARSNRAIKQSARQQLVANIQQAMRDNYIAQADAYAQSAKDLAEYVTTQEEQAKDFIHRQDANRDKIRSYAQRDLEGLATNPNRDRTRGNIARQIWDAFASPIRDLQSLLRLTGMHAPDGEGYLYNHFMRGWMDGADKERLGIVNASKTLDEKISELTHGKYKTWEEAARKIDDASHNMFTITMLNGVDGKDMPVEEEIPLNAGNALYIYAVNKMTDGRMKLAGMNITEEDVKALTDKVREQFGQEILDVVDWIQSEYFSQLRNRYNPTHEALFGAPMDAIENYFPLRINANARQQNEDLSEPDTDAARLLAGTSTGAIKRRTRNSLPLDVRNADFFQEVIRHISQMERWNAFAQWNRDANILFSDINFRNRIKGMKGTIYGEGDKLYNYMKDAFRVAIGTYKPKTDTFSEITLNMAKGVTSAKINFRNFTAIKQLASFPSFFTYVAEKGFLRSYMRNWMKPHETMKWAKEHLPNFEKRVSKRDMGDMRLMQRTTDWQWNKRILELSSKYGMYFNVLFDTLTCATGARAVYDARYAKYIGIGYTQEDAASKARQDAEQSFNTSQQSSEGAFMSPVQMDRNLVTAALTVFRTSPIQYTRNGFYHARNLVRKYGRKDEMITFRAGQYKNEGMSEEKAMQAAEKDFTKSIKADAVGVTVYFAILGIFWRLVGQVPYLLFGDDDDKKKEILKDAVTGGGLVQPITGLLGGGIIESALDGNGSIADMFAPEMPFTQDIRRATDYLKNDKYAEFASQALSVLMQSGTGFDPQTASDMIQRIVTTIDSEEELDAATKAIQISFAVASVPQSQYEQQLVDRVVADDSEYDAALMDYIRYQKVHTAPLTWWLRGEESDEKAEENAEKRFNKLLTERDKIKNPEDYEE